MTVTSPIDGRSAGSFDMMNAEQISRTMRSVEAGADSWSRRPVEERAAAARRIADALRSQRERLALAAAVEMGKPVTLLRTEIDFSARIFDYYAAHAQEFLSPTAISDSETERASVRLRPIGAILAIMPWNYPFYQVARSVAPNLILGNVMLLKHAQQCTGTSLAFERIVREATGEDGVLRSLVCVHAQLDAVIDSDIVRGVTLTGSERAGIAVAERSGRALKKVVLELGGSDPLIVLPDADLDLAVDLAVGGRNQNSGQACTAAKRFIVDASLLSEFTARYTERIAQIQLGDPTLDSTTHGPLSSVDAADRLLEQVRGALSEGAALLHGSLESVHDAWFPPMLLAGIRPDMHVHHEELFGPVAMLYSAASEQEAIRLASDTPFGLGAIVCTQDAQRAEQLAEQLPVGMVYVNSLERSREDLPFGGVKRSGFGRELGRQGLAEFANQQLVFVQK